MSHTDSLNPSLDIPPEAESGPSTSPPALPNRKKTYPPKSTSIYTIPSDQRGQSLSTSLIRQQPDNVPRLRSEAKTSGVLGRDVYQARTKKGWETRRVVGEERWERGLDFLSPSLSEKHLPNDDLLDALHLHASQFYDSHNLLFPPRKQTRHTQWESRKRVLIETEGVILPNKRKTRGNGKGQGKGETRRGGEEEAGGEGLDGLDGEGGKKGPYKKRDMYKALDGSALLTLGILVEEHIAQDLYKAGYRPQRDVDEERAGESENRNGNVVHPDEDDEDGEDGEKGDSEVQDEEDEKGQSEAEDDEKGDSEVDAELYEDDVSLADTS